MQLFINHRKGTVLCVALVCLFCLMFSVAALAGNGDGTGGGSGDPLSLAAANPANGQHNVSTKTQIQLTFNKNVVNMTVHDANMRCFSLYTAKGSKVAIKVSMADDQIYPEKKRDVVLIPNQSLQAGTGYIVKIAGSLQAKNGTTLGHEVRVAFTTAGTAKTSATVTPTKPKTTTSTTQQKTESKSKTTQQQNVQKQENKQTNKQEQQNAATTKPQTTQPTAVGSKAQTKTPYIILALVTALLVMGFGFYKFKK